MKITTGLKFVALSGFLITSCLVPLRSFKNTKQPSPPDYANRLYWAALPDKLDSCDFELTGYGVVDGQKKARADVFFIPPTNYLNGYKWNASVNDSIARELTQKIGCKLQASVFNESCKIYVPHYRTAILYSYFAIRKKNGRQAFALAYDDVRRAFLYYLKHYNKGRPIIIASHSQGTDYAVSLVKDFFDKDTTLNKKLIAAYLIGRPIYDTTFKQLKLMSSPSETGGYVTWNTVAYRTNTFYGDPVGKILGVNPLSWKTDTVHVPHQKNLGGLPFTANKIDTALTDAKVAPSGFLWVHAPALKKPLNHYPGMNTFYYHKNDYAFFYMNIRENVKLRIETYFKKYPA
ncbi:hypothetical protein CNR22_14175 [Sphingobacteriaceae bacterium]|nr:hypothetical protein CNR22_14175 [Sphingobacteriaceae bacterium]